VGVWTQQWYQQQNNFIPYFDCINNNSDFKNFNIQIFAKIFKHMWNFKYIYNKMAYSVLTQLQYINILATCFGFFKTIFRPMLTIGRYIQCVHTVWDPLVFTWNHITVIIKMLSFKKASLGCTVGYILRLIRDIRKYSFFKINSFYDYDFYVHTMGSRSSLWLTLAWRWFCKNAKHVAKKLMYYSCVKTE
jgi:hypothetical protein